ncbi:MAG: hypothetical protein RSF81_01750 [Oscillospiraceae bacterium]
MQGTSCLQTEIICGENMQGTSVLADYDCIFLACGENMQGIVLADYCNLCLLEEVYY